MAKAFEKNTQWYMATIYDPSFLPGISIYNVIKLLLKKINVQFVVLSDLEGAGITNLINDDEILVIHIDEFLKRVGTVKQFDWGDFFLFNFFPSNWKTFKNKSYPEIISLTETTVRAIDDSYIYIYTPYNEVVQLIKSHYPVEEIKEGNLESLDYPF